VGADNRRHRGRAGNDAVALFHGLREVLPAQGIAEMVVADIE
jgi:hypothetical protein